MSLGICILSYNHPEITARAVRSVLSLSSNLVLIHNGSEASNVRKLKAEFPSVEHFEIEKNVGYSGGVNVGLKKSFESNEWVLFLTNDCELLSLPALQAPPAINRSRRDGADRRDSEIVAPVIYRRKIGNIDSIGGGFDPRVGKLVHFRSESDFSNAEKNGWIPYLPGSAFLLYKDVFDSVGGMDSKLGTYWEDVDWSVRAGAKGFKIRIDDNFKVLHRVGKTCHKNPLYSIYYFQRNRKKVSWKYCPTKHKPLLVSKLATDWIRLGSRLILNKRTRDLRLLKDAALD